MRRALVIGVTFSALSVVVGTSASAAPAPSEASGTEAEKRGCCSHHHGVCGCSDGHMTMCCDGTTSPTCGC
jgi:hypothetical protein